MEDLQPTTLMPQSQNCSGEEEEEEDCAMLTALGGRWCPEANLQNSEFTKVTQQCKCILNNTPCITDLKP